MKQFDILIIGGGAAGSKCADTANRLGYRVALIERDTLGGTCLNYGCDPTKALLYSAQLLYQAQHGECYGLGLSANPADWNKLQTHMKDVIHTVRGHTKEEAQTMMEEAEIALFWGEASFASPHEVIVNDETLAAEQIVIATGSEPTIPAIPGLAETGFVTNKKLLYQASLPGRLAVVGGGSVGVEFAQMMHRFGVAVHLIESEMHILPQDEPELTDMLAHSLREEGISVETNTQVVRTKRHKEARQLVLQYENEYEKEILVDEILVATGRHPAIEGLNLEAAGVEIEEDHIKVNEMLRTSVPHIWAAGDVVTDYPFTHVAWRQGEHIAQNVFAAAPKPFAPGPIPWVSYTDPALAHVGQTEAQLQQAGIPYRVARHGLERSSRAIIMRQEVGLIKLLVGEDDLLLGGHILADRAGELIAVLVLAMKAGLPIQALQDAVFPYPTLGEAIGEAARGLLAAAK